MTEAERVLAEVAVLFRPTGGIVNVIRVRELLEPYLPKPEPDPLTVAARECVATTALSRSPIEAVAVTRTIIAREVAAAEPSDEVIERVFRLGFNASRNWNHDNIRAALKGEGA